jgi:hypothetical protein
MRHLPGGSTTEVLQEGRPFRLKLHKLPSFKLPKTSFHPRMSLILMFVCVCVPRVHTQNMRTKTATPLHRAAYCGILTLFDASPLTRARAQRLHTTVYSRLFCRAQPLPQSTPKQRRVTLGETD